MANTLGEFIKKHALENYEAGGWDVVVECWDDAEIESHLQTCNAQDEAGALAAFAPLVDVWSDQQADADYYREGPPDPAWMYEEGD